MAGTQAFFARATELHETSPERVATDGLTAYPWAIKEALGKDVEHEIRPCTANPMEQSHRRVKYRYYPSPGYGDFEAAQRFCQVVDEVDHGLRPRSQMAAFVCLGDLRQRFMKGVEELAILFQAA